MVSSACPEKIAEFEERKSQEKKQNHRKPRPKKSNRRTALAEIDKQLQNLLLDIEGGSSSQNASFSSTMTTSKTQTDATKPEKTQYLLLDTDSESETDNHNEGVIFHQNGRTGAETVIDLLSPSPPIRTRKVSKCQQGNNGRGIDVIDLSDWETGMITSIWKKYRWECSYPERTLAITCNLPICLLSFLLLWP